MTEVKEQRERIENFRMQLLLAHPFWGHLLLAVKLREIPPLYRNFLAATNGFDVIYYNSFAISKITDLQLGGLFAHELLHIILRHSIRRGDREPFFWNWAADFVINNIILDSTKWKLPGQREIAEEIKKMIWMNMTEEEIYDWLKVHKEWFERMKIAIPAGNHFFSGKDIIEENGWPAEMTSDELSGIIHPEAIDVHFELPFHADKKRVSEKINEIVKSAYEISANSNERGTLPGFIVEYIKKGIRESGVPWENKLRSFVGEAYGRNDYVRFPPSRRYLAISDELFLPRIKAPETGKLVIAVDTSGSISSKLLEKFAGEILKLSTVSSSLTIITCDCEIHKVIRTAEIDNFIKNMEFAGRGGTSHIPVFDYVEENNITPTVLIALTDLYSEFPEKKPEYPVIWCVPDGHDRGPGWGEIVEIPE